MSLLFTSEISKAVNQFIADNIYSSIAVLVDNNTHKYCYPILKNSLPEHALIEIRSGEAFKTIETCKVIWEGLTENKYDRNSLLINLGGGVIGDMGGFCAATYKRGIDFINIPTTLLSQVDASIGGKLGVDFGGYKNHIGLFKDPNAIIIDTVFLKTLPDEQLLSGFAEVIKHSIIESKDQWNFLKASRFEDIDFSDLIPKSVDIKKKVVLEDPFENGKRKILNFGHTVGHALESHYLETDNALLHGEAVAAGMVCESYIAGKLGILKESDVDEIITYIDHQYPRHKILESDYQKICNLAQQDKKNKGHKILMSLPEEIGSAVYDIEVSQQLFLKSLDFYSNH